jgi:hypothetical protein
MKTHSRDVLPPPPGRRGGGAWNHREECDLLSWGKPGLAGMASPDRLQRFAVRSTRFLQPEARAAWHIAGEPSGPRRL